MNPSHLARLAWYSGPDPPANSFDDVLNWHLHTPGAVVISLPSAFLLARPVIAFAPDLAHLTLSPLESSAPADCWHVCSAAGDLSALLCLAEMHPLPWVSFCRHGQARVRRYRLNELLRHGQPESTKNPRASTAPTAGIGIREGASIR